MKKYLFGLMILLLISAPAFAGSGSCCEKKKVKKVCFVMSSMSAIPQPCDRLGQIPTTAIPMFIIGNH